MRRFSLSRVFSFVHAPLLFPRFLLFLSSFRPTFNFRPKPLCLTSKQRRKIANRTSSVIMNKNYSNSFYKRQLPNHLVELNSVEGKRRFTSALQKGNAEAFFPLVSQFQTQSHPALCGLTTLATILNALEIDPKRVWAHPWRWFAESLLDCCLDMEMVKVSGVTMDQLACTAGCQGSQVNTWRGLDPDKARTLIRRSVQGLSNGLFEFVVASYDRATLGQTGTGHFSPIAAYDEDTDSVLVLDTARFKYAPHWIPLKQLVAATEPIDSATGSPRGFLTFKKFGEEQIEMQQKKHEICKEMKCHGQLLAT